MALGRLPMDFGWRSASSDGPCPVNQRAHGAWNERWKIAATSNEAASSNRRTGSVRVFASSTEGTSLKFLFQRAAAGMFATVLLLLPPVAAGAADRAEALVRYVTGDHAGAIGLLRIHADQGDAVCQEILGNMYFK